MIRHFLYSPQEKYHNTLVIVMRYVKIKDCCGLCRGKVLDVDRKVCNWDRAFWESNLCAHKRGKFIISFVLWNDMSFWWNDSSVTFPVVEKAWNKGRAVWQDGKSQWNLYRENVAVFLWHRVQDLLGKVHMSMPWKCLSARPEIIW